MAGVQKLIPIKYFFLGGGGVWVGQRLEKMSGVLWRQEDGEGASYFYTLSKNSEN